MRMPKFRINMDLVQDVVNAKGTEGVSMAELMEITRLTYAQVQEATRNLRSRDRIISRKYTGSHQLIFFPKE